jgi:hypothetical protein
LSCRPKACSRIAGLPQSARRASGDAILPHRRHESAPRTFCHKAIYRRTSTPGNLTGPLLWAPRRNFSPLLPQRKSEGSRQRLLLCLKDFEAFRDGWPKRFRANTFSHTKNQGQTRDRGSHQLDNQIDSGVRSHFPNTSRGCAVNELEPTRTQTRLAALR